MTARLFGVCVALELSMSMATGVALLAQTQGVLPCPPRERGAPKPEGCYDPCPKGMVGEESNCACPPGTQLAGRPTSPSERDAFQSNHRPRSRSNAQKRSRVRKGRLELVRSTATVPRV